VELVQLVTCPVLVIIKQVNPSSSPAGKFFFVVVEFELGFIIIKMLIYICEDFFIEPVPKM
jgi:hypothetical protein